MVAGQRSFVFSTLPARTRRAGLIYNTMTWCLPLTRIPIPQELEQRKMHFFVSFLPCYESQITSHRLITCSSVCLWYFSSDKRAGRWVSDCGRASKWLEVFALRLLDEVDSWKILSAFFFCYSKYYGCTMYYICKLCILYK